MDIILWLLLLLSLILCFWAIATVFALFWTRVPFVRTPKRIISLILSHAQFKPGQQVFELGCGEASFLRAVEKRFPEVELIGYEVSLVAYFLARFKKLFRRSQVKIRLKNFYKVNLSSANYLYCYLWPSIMERLRPKLETELKPGTEVVSLAFPIKAWTPDKTIDTKIKGRGKIYYYKIKD